MIYQNEKVDFLFIGRIRISDLVSDNTCFEMTYLENFYVFIQDAIMKRTNVKNEINMFLFYIYAVNNLKIFKMKT